ncbi:probable ubiquitin thioesterase DG1039 [Bactrocera neohumeralis]|uniref:probable ubiquitin thioesterase DG1039 n=1 Tax=Bactrocera neohumeralis TaxID=98809 RepID=UPI0021669E8A|nr:probable ubiquitin thioesterase DG1039 [Bactrocera neohumeralis]
MATLVQALLFMCLCYQNLWITYGATLSPLRISHPVKSQQRNNEYLPPFTTEAENIVEKSINYSSNTIRPPTTYQTQQANKIHQPTQQFASKNLSNTQQATKNLYTSYAAPASGSAPFLYSQPLAANQVPLPTLFPKSLVEHLSPAAQTPTQMQMQQLQQRQQQQQQQQLQKQQQSLYTDYTKQLTSDLPLANTPLLMVEEPTSSLLTPSQNLTLEAARILASTLLEANGEAPLETPGLAPLSNPSALELPNKLNSTDVLILKSQKNAYIIPAPLAKDARNPTNARALYQMRDQLDKAYTINQFVFIIKPERINFLNKLV